MTSVLSNFAGNRALQYLLSGPCYLACHNTNPTPAGLLATEVAGGGYGRQLITFGGFASKTAVSTNSIVFPGMPVSTVPFLAVWDAISDGNLLFVIDLVALGHAALSVLGSGQVKLRPGDIAITV